MNTAEQPGQAGSHTTRGRLAARVTALRSSVPAAGYRPRQVDGSHGERGPDG